MVKKRTDTIKAEHAGAQDAFKWVLEHTSLLR
jgi:hypothetical protein